MKCRQTDRLVAAAAAPALTRIAGDRRRVGPRIRPLLSYIGDHLFDPGLTVTRLKRSCGVRDNSVSNHFHREVGEPPSTYIAARRLETAARLLAETNVEVWRLSELLGYSSLQVFSRAFTRWRGERPTIYRKKHAQQSAAVLRPAKPRQLPTPIRGALETVTGLLDCSTVDVLRAEAIWQTVRDRPREEQLRLVRAVANAKPGLFELLHAESRQQGRADRRRGVVLAELAVASLPVGEPGAILADLAARKARSWAWVANARSLAMDFFGAEEAFGLAQRWLSDGTDAAVHAEVVYLLSCFRALQSRNEEALKLVNRALVIARKTGMKRPLAEILIQRGLVCFEIDRPNDALTSLHEARVLLASSDDTYLKMSAAHCIAVAYAQLGKLEQAKALLPEVHRYCDELDQAYVRCHLLNLEADIHLADKNLTGAEVAYRSALAGFEALGEVLKASTAALDLSMIRLKQGDAPEAATLASLAYRLIEGLAIRREASAAREILRVAIASRRLSASNLEKARGLLGPRRVRVNSARGRRTS